MCGCANLFYVDDVDDDDKGDDGNDDCNDDGHDNDDYDNEKEKPDSNICVQKRNLCS